MDVNDVDILKLAAEYHSDFCRAMEYEWQYFSYGNIDAIKVRHDNIADRIGEKYADREWMTLEHYENHDKRKAHQDNKQGQDLFKGPVLTFLNQYINQDSTKRYDPSS